MAADTSTQDAKPLPRIGSYELLQPLGSGGMSSVFRARHVETGLVVAVKVLPRALAKNPIVLQRFLREARSAESLEHPNIVAIYDHGVDQGRHYLVLEYVEGGDLHDRVRAEGPLPIGEAVAVVRAVAEGLRFAAGRGLIHRDIKPANLLLTTGGRVKIADLGLALHAAEEDERVTREGTTVGTVDYMSPEQARDSRATSVRSDIYSLGCTLYFLLTGQPPFPGGDVAEKLNRHINAERPDPRVLRPEIPGNLAALIRTMLARRPEARFPGYSELIAALAALELPTGVEAAHAVDAPFALIVDDEDEDKSPEPDDDDFGFVPLSPSPETTVRAEARASSPLLLAEFDDDEALAPPVPAPVKPGRPRLTTFTDVEEEVADRPFASSGAAPPPQFASHRMSQSERSWLTKCVLAGVGLVLLVITIDQVNRATRTEPPATAEPAADLPVDAVIPRQPVAEAPETSAAPAVVARPKVKVVPSPRPAAPPWVEPGDPTPDVVAETDLGAALESVYLPGWVRERASKTAAVPVTVRRLPDPGRPNQKPDLRVALDAPGVPVEISDNGPFFEEGFHVVGDARVVRSKPGFRAVVCLGRTKGDGLSGPLIHFGAKSLTLEGIDLVVDVAGLSRSQSALFAGQGGTLTLRECTVTVVNKGAAPFSIVRTLPGDRPTRVYLDRTLVRGTMSSVFEVQGGPVDLVVDRSLVVNGQGVGVSFAGPAAGLAADARRATFVRSVVVTARSAFERVDVSPGARPSPVTLGALGSTFARFDLKFPSALLASGSDATQVADLVDWRGDHNTFDGWPEWLSAGVRRVPKVADLAAARTAWRGTDPASVESTRAWPLLPPSPDAVVPAQARPHAPNRLDVLSRVPTPTPWLHEKTVAAFLWPAIPTLPGPAGPAGVSAPVARQLPKFGPADSRDMVASDFRPQSGYGGSRVAVGEAPPPGAKVREFKTTDVAWGGDLGRFLAAEAKPGDELLYVKVTGSGRHPWTPVRLPDGVSVEIRVSPDPAGGAPSWVAVPGSRADALLDVRGASLVLRGLVVERDGGSTLARLFRVEGGHLVVKACRLSAPGGVETGAGGLLGFHAATTQPLARERPSWPFDTPATRPTCLVTESVLMTGGEVLAAEVGRGLVAFFQCVVASGTTAFALTPGKVARRNFDADLVLDHCSVAAERAFVSLGPWPGSEPGPDRPWLVSTFGTAFFGVFDKPVTEREGVLLSADPDALARGVVFWQSNADALEVPNLIAAAGRAVPPPKPLDARRVWTAFWGDRHAVNVTGTRPGPGPAGVRLAGLLKPGDVRPADLAIVAVPPGRTPGDLGADFARLGIPVPPPGPGR